MRKDAADAADAAAAHRSRPQAWPALAATALLAGWLVGAGPLPAARDSRGDGNADEYTDHDPPRGYEIDLYRTLRRPRPRNAAIQAALDAIQNARRNVLALANGTRWGEDRTMKYLLFTHHYERALAQAARYRLEYAKMREIREPDLIDDLDLQKEILRAREWGTSTALVLLDPIHPRRPYVQVQRVLFD
jgi:hypothetical protein